MLLDILERYAQQTGTRLDNANSKASAIKDINEAAKALYESDDFKYCLFEQVFSFDLTNPIVTLPYYVDIIRGVRCLESKTPLTIIDKAPRYQYGKKYQDSADFRIKNKLAIAQDLDNETALVVSIPAQNDEAFTVTIVGSTANSDREEETLSFSATDTTKTTTRSWTNHPGIEGIYKNKSTKYNVTVKDQSATPLTIATIPAHMKFTQYLLVQLREPDQTGSGTKCFEILFKHIFQPFTTDYSKFICPGYDDAILHKTLAVYYGRSKDQADIVKSIKEDKQAHKLAKAVNFDNTRTEEHRIQVKPTGTQRAYRRIVGRGY